MFQSESADCEESMSQLFKVTQEDFGRLRLDEKDEGRYKEMAKAKFGESDENRDQKIQELKAKLENDSPELVKNRPSDEIWSDYLLMFLRTNGFRGKESAASLANHLKILRAEPKYFMPVIIIS